MAIQDEPVRGSYGNPTLFGLSGIEQMRAAIDGYTPKAPIHYLTGLRLVEAGIGSATWAMPASPWFQSAAGIFLGGIGAFLADAPLGSSIYTTLPPATPLITSELSMSFLRPATVNSEKLIARGRLIQSGTKVGLSEVLVEDGLGRLLAHGSSRCFILPSIDPPPPRPERLEKVRDPSFDTPHPYLRQVEAKPLPPSIREGKSGLEITNAHIKGEIPLPPWAMLFGSRPVEADEGTATLEVNVTGWLTSGTGNMYGGAIALFADAAMLTSVYTTLPPDTATATLDLKVHYLRPVLPGTKLRARADVVHRGRTMAVVHCRLTNDEGKVAAVAQGSTLIAPGRPVDRDHPLVPADEAYVE
jgi:uncharacterized protein (TIGR00369 family)